MALPGSPMVQPLKEKVIELLVELAVVVVVVGMRPGSPQKHKRSQSEFGGEDAQSALVNVE